MKQEALNLPKISRRRFLYLLTSAALTSCRPQEIKPTLIKSSQDAIDARLYLTPVTIPAKPTELGNMDFVNNNELNRYALSVIAQQITDEKRLDELLNIFDPLDLSVHLAQYRDAHLNHKNLIKLRLDELTNLIDARKTNPDLITDKMLNDKLHEVLRNLDALRGAIQDQQSK
jgi:hypothetical protein